MNPAPTVFRQQLLAALPRVRRYARSLLFDTHAADDLVQSTVERALTHWHQYDQQRDLLGWLLSIAHNAHLDTLRRERRTSTVDPQDLSGMQDAAMAAHPGPDPSLRLDILKALSRLPTEQRECLLLVGVECLSYAQCAESLRIPIGTVMSRVSRGRVALRALLDGPPAEPARPGAAAPPALRRVR